MDVAEDDVEVLAKGDVAVAVYNELAADAVAGNVQMPGAPLLIEGEMFVVLVGMADDFGYAGCEAVGRQEVSGGAEEGHGAIDADTEIYVVVQSHIGHMAQVVEAVPWRKTEHQGDGNLAVKPFDGLDEPVVTVDTPHALIGLPWLVEREVEVAWRKPLYIIRQQIGCKTVRKKREIAVMNGEPLEDGCGLRMEDELAAFETYGGEARDAAALH